MITVIHILILDEYCLLRISIENSVLCTIKLNSPRWRHLSGHIPTMEIRYQSEPLPTTQLLSEIILLSYLSKLNTGLEED